ncbi:alpha/beta hydrolase [Opitutus terrae]|uniref:Serine aminopeptidase S33 domain-containing protein n=1 Tax=Opitutus terrae (strain DSM 11246 / JCM 15787 / PB90-1) TaxID=452637 RepID=B1ZUW7_OPITP|nr:alpha/beta hydrolase [Opitutus terrae]ACB75937.1 conserved hypothetical protein [Opitutus terrae PB90-1]
MKAPRRRGLGLRSALALVVIYGAVTLWARSLSDSMLFLPDYGSRVEPAGAVRIDVGEGIAVSAVYLPNPAARFTVWYFHGNAEALGDLTPRLEKLRELGFAVFAVEYPGYGASGGVPTERSIYAANRAALAYLRERVHVPPEKVILYGRSVGGGPATEIAAKENVGGLVLESAFVSAYRVMTRWPLLPGDKFRNLAKLRDVRCPVLVIHGRADRVIPCWHGEALYAAARGTKQHLWIDTAGHNDLLEWAGDRYGKALQEFTGLVAAPSGHGTTAIQ